MFSSVNGVSWEYVLFFWSDEYFINSWKQWTSPLRSHVVMKEKNERALLFNVVVSNMTSNVQGTFSYCNWPFYGSPAAFWYLFKIMPIRIQTGLLLLSTIFKIKLCLATAVCLGVLCQFNLCFYLLDFKRSNMSTLSIVCLNIGASIFTPVIQKQKKRRVVLIILSVQLI